MIWYTNILLSVIFLPKNINFLEGKINAFKLKFLILFMGQI